MHIPFPDSNFAQSFFCSKKGEGGGKNFYFLVRFCAKVGKLICVTFSPPPVPSQKKKTRTETFFIAARYNNRRRRKNPQTKTKKEKHKQPVSSQTTEKKSAESVPPSKFEIRKAGVVFHFLCGSWGWADTRPHGSLQDPPSIQLPPFPPRNFCSEEVEERTKR